MPLQLLTVRAGLFCRMQRVNEVMKYFDAEITDSTSIYLQNMIEEALDDLVIRWR